MVVNVITVYFRFHLPSAILDTRSQISPIVDLYDQVECQDLVECFFYFYRIPVSYLNITGYNN